MNILDGDEHGLSSDGVQWERDIVQFVPFRNFKGSHPSRLAAETLAEIPAQVTRTPSAWCVCVSPDRLTPGAVPRLHEEARHQAQPAAAGPAVPVLHSGAAESSAWRTSTGPPPLASAPPPLFIIHGVRLSRALSGRSDVPATAGHVSFAAAATAGHVPAARHLPAPPAASCWQQGAGRSRSAAPTRPASWILSSALRRVRLPIPLVTRASSRRHD
jgi:hypothetical protein